MRRILLHSLRRIQAGEWDREQALEELSRSVVPMGQKTAKALLLNTLRFWWCIAPGLREIAGKKIPKDVLGALVLTLVQIRLMDQIPEHAAKAEFQKLLVPTFKALKGWANWLLNEWLRQYPEIPSEPIFPSFWMDELVSAIGKDEARSFCRGIQRTPRLLQAGQEEGRLKFFTEEESVPMKAFQCDAASVWAALSFLNQGKAHLDLCSAPGNKLMLHCLKSPGVHAVSVELQKSRYERMIQRFQSEDLAERIEFLQADALDALNVFLREGRRFDTIFLDAPCSAWGTVLSHPEYLFHKTASDSTYHQPLQKELFSNALKCLEPGGEMIYCVCTFNRTETIEIVGESHEGYEEVPLVASHGLRTLRFGAGQLGLPEEEGNQIFYTSCWRKVS